MPRKHQTRKTHPLNCPRTHAGGYFVAGVDDVPIHPRRCAKGPPWGRGRAAHGQPRTNADKRRAVEIAIKEFPKLSSREIAKVCAVSDMFVGKVRPAEVQTVCTSTRTGADGKERKMPAPAAKPAKQWPEPVSAAELCKDKPAPREIVVPFVVPPLRAKGWRARTSKKCPSKLSVSQAGKQRSP